ncbi:GNAT family N-acetyltransferase [Rossellomorea aquimaris]|uniref:GNAT family N-acetyltransferase n=1 Tax=Rossellomorea aquimaris TaxID=189382 RepID=UPI001CD34037|nr:GNAT family N-acetyltransferase [Rossellomorea aquimaris]MCA1058882.1 GNAT family N-acetyltransferase [Rossellomorea aquimaris]
MRIRLTNDQDIVIRKYTTEDYIHIHKLNVDEQWNTLVEKHESTKNAWNNSNVAFVAMRKDEIIAYVRGLTDQSISLYICELLVKKEFRGMGVGDTLLQYVHNIYPDTRIEMLANTSSHTYYEQKGYRSFYGYRKSFQEN